tara:strand:- start:5210 stop:5506 length:297 start_codon:yes stop_codon:yes gene_type:complete
MENENEELYQKPPSIFQMLKSFSVEALTHIANKGKNISSEDYADRIDQCNSCPNLIKKNMRCKLCGCLVQFKAKWETTTCPDQPPRWKPQKIALNEEK